MKLLVISRWGATCGVSLHAELLVREFMRMGVEVTVLAPTVESACRDWHHKLISQRDERWVIRGYVEGDDLFSGKVLARDLVVNGDHDAILIESYERMPLADLGELIRRVRGKKTVVAVVHNSRRDDASVLASLRLDAYVVFDDRWLREMFGPYGGIVDRVLTIPYPAATPPAVSAKVRAGEGGKLRFFSFGRQPVEEYRDFIAVLDRLSQRYDLEYRVVRSDGPLPVRKPWLTQRQARLTLEEVYGELVEADIHLLPKGDTSRIVLSSTVYQTIGSLVPIVTRWGRYVEDIPTDAYGWGAIVKYRGLEDLRSKLVRLVEDPGMFLRVKELARRFAERHSPRLIAKMFLDVLSGRPTLRKAYAAGVGGLTRYSLALKA